MYTIFFRKDSRSRIDVGGISLTPLKTWRKIAKIAVTTETIGVLLRGIFFRETYHAEYVFFLFKHNTKNSDMYYKRLCKLVIH